MAITKMSVMNTVPPVVVQQEKQRSGDDVCQAMRVSTCASTCVQAICASHVCIDMLWAMCAGRCIDMCTDMCINVCTDKCADMWFRIESRWAVITNVSSN